MGSPNILRLSIAENLAWKEVLEVIAGQSFVNFPNHDVASKGNRLATEAYVETYVQENPPASSSSIFVLERSIWIDPLPTVLPAQIVLMWPTLVPIGAVLTELRYSHFTEDQNVDTKESQCSIQFTDTLYNIVKVVFNIDAQWGVSLTVWATHVIIGGANDPPTWSPIKQITISENGTYMALGGAEGLSVTLRFGMAA
jgi:hypothetical protein